ncbi:MAG: GMC family oxidoreductase [Pirellulaceae bacterium]
MTKEDFRSDYDFIIVGAGTAGCLVARQLSSVPSLRVLLIEAGGGLEHREAIKRPAEYLSLQGSDIDWHYSTETSSDLSGRRMICPRGRVLGGCSAMNAMIFHEGVPDDYRSWRESGGDPWSVTAMESSRKELLNGVRSMLSIERPSHVSAACEAFMQATPIACREHQIAGAPEVYLRTTKGGERQTAWEAFLGNAKRRNVSVATNAVVEKIEFSRRCASHVRLRHRGTSQTVMARRAIVLSGGSIASPQLLMLSGIGKREDLMFHGIDCRLELPAVGSKLRDHLAFPVIFEIPERYRFPTRWSMRDLVRWSHLQQGPIGSNLAEVGGFFDLPEFGRRSIQLHVTPTHYLRHPAADAPAAMTLAVTQTQPNSSGSVSLRSNRIDDPPLIDPRYLGDHEDVRTLSAGIEWARKIAATEPLASFVGSELLPGSKRHTDSHLERAIRRFAMTALSSRRHLLAR